MYDSTCSFFVVFEAFLCDKRTSLTNTEKNNEKVKPYNSHNKNRRREKTIKI